MHQRPTEALQWGNPQTTDRLSLLMVGHSFTLDVICHCRSEAQARALWSSIETRLAACRLELNLQKTKVVFCKSTRRPGEYPSVSFDFLGYTFRPRRAKSRWGPFVGFSPAVSRSAVASMQHKVCAWCMAHGAEYGQIHRGPG